jgi:tripartite-type tricarboxylate transporter receptor subunit TctC
MRKFVSLLFAAALGLTLLGTCVAASFPEKPLRYVLPFTPGGAADTAAKLQQKYLEKVLGQKIEIVYNPGNGGGDAWTDAVKGTPDGYTVTGCNMPNIIIQPFENPAVGYKTEEINLVYIFASTPDALMVSKSSPYNSIADLIKAAKANPSSVTIGGGAIGSAPHLGSVQFEKAAGVKLPFVATSLGTKVAVSSLHAGKISALMTPPGTALTEKDLKILAVATTKRLSSLPKVPTFQELGYKFTEGTYRAVAVPPGTPPAVMKTLEAAFAKINKDPGFQAEMVKAGFEIENYGIEASKKFLTERIKYYQGIRGELGL